MNYKSEDYKKWLKNFRIYSKTKSSNSRVLSLYDFILKHQYEDSDHWHTGGSNEIQSFLNSFTKGDWNDLKKDITHWTIDHQLIVVNSIAFGFDGMFDIALQKDIIPDASDFLTSLFNILEDEEIREEIAYFAFFVNIGNPKPIETLLKIKAWMLQRGYNNELWLNSKTNPLGHIEDAIKKASR